MRRAKALALLAAGQRVKVVAAELQVTESTIYRWMAGSDFAAELDRLLALQRTEAERILRATAAEAAEALAVVTKGSGGLMGRDRVSAASQVLDRIGMIAPKAPAQTVDLTVKGDADLAVSDEELEARIRATVERLTPQG